MIGVAFFLIFSLIACKSMKVRDEESGKEFVRIYDVEQHKDKSINFTQHCARAGVFKFADGFNNESNIPFANQIQSIQEDSAVEIEYVIFNSWEELRKNLEETENDGVTTIVLFNNSYDKSILKEVESGRYANMEQALQEYGFYDEDAYNQTVLSAGMFEDGQLLVPILYNVAGMVQGDSEIYEYEDWKEVAYNHVQQDTLDFETFLEYLKDSIYSSDLEEMEVPYMSVGFLEDKVDLFLTASGANLQEYVNQEELFNLLYTYLKYYKENAGTSQEMYAKYLNECENKLFDSYITDDMVENLKLSYSDPNIPTNEWPLWLLAESLFDRTEYFIECSSAEDTAYHSVFGILAYRLYYVNYKVGMNGFEVVQTGNMNYWPIGILNSPTKYAAQPICYAAVLEGGSTRTAAKVLKSMMSQDVEVKYGISVCKKSKEKQIEEWKGKFDTNLSRIRSTSVNNEGIMVETGETSYWGILMTSPASFLEDKEIYVNQVQRQLDNIVTAYIPDREILQIWQDAINETVTSKISTEEGFELLCKRMSEWYK